MNVRIVAALLPVLMCVAAPAQATAYAAPQGARATGTLEVHIFDAERAALAGVSVTLEGDGLIQGVATGSSNASGACRFRGVRPGEYLLVAELPGFRTAEYRARVSVGATAQIDILLEVAGVEETVLVTREAPLIEPRSAQVANTFGEQLIQNIPLAREFIEIADLAPGVNDRGAYGAGADVSGRYQRGSASNAYTLNGVDVTEPSWGNTWINPGIDTIAEVQVVGIGAPAEYGNFTGATVNLVTKGGTNRYAGSFGYYFRDSGLRGNNAGGNASFERGELDYNHELSASFGGPLIRDRLLFFANVGYETNSEAAYLSETFTELNHYRYHGRLDYLLDENNTLGLMLNSNPSHDRNLGLQAGFSPEVGYGVDFSTVAWLASWQSQLGGDTYLDARYSGYKGRNDYVPNTCCDVPGAWDYSTGILYGSSSYLFKKNNGRHAVDASVSHYADEFLGAAHDFKFGIEWDHTWSLDTFEYTGGASLGIYPYGGYTYVYGYTFGREIDADVDRAALHVQDNVRVSDNVTLNLGVRYDRASIEDAYDGPGGRPGKVASYDFFAPRLGLSVDLTGQARYVAHGSWGRYFEKPLSSKTTSSGGYGSTSYDAYRTVVAGRLDLSSVDTRALEEMVIDPANLWFSSRMSGVPVDPDLRGPRTDVLNVGFQAEVARDYVLGLEFVHKRDADFVVTEDRQSHTYEPFQYTDPLGGTQTLHTRTDRNPADPWITNSDYYYRRHNMVMLSFQRRASRNFNFSTSITYQHSTGNIENNYQTALGAGASGESTSPNFNGHPYTVGRLTYNRDWQLKALANYRMPGGILASGYFRWMTGRPWTPTVRSRALPQSLNENKLVVLEPRGSRNAPALSQFDLRLQKSFELRGRQGRRLEVILDVFNLFNSDSPTSVASRLGSTYYFSQEPAFGLPAWLIAPRQAQLGVRFTF